MESIHLPIVRNVEVMDRAKSRSIERLIKRYESKTQGFAECPNRLQISQESLVTWSRKRVWNLLNVLDRFSLISQFFFHSKFV